MSTTPTDLQDRSHQPRLSRLLASRRRRLAAVVVVLLIVAGVVIGVTDPFASSGNSSGGVSDNAYPTSVATVNEEPLSSQTQVDATLGYEGSFTVSIPSGVAAAQLTADHQSLQSAEDKVAADESALSSAEAIATPTTRDLARRRDGGPVRYHGSHRRQRTSSPPTDISAARLRPPLR